MSITETKLHSLMHVDNWVILYDLELSSRPREVIVWSVCSVKSGFDCHDTTREEVGYLWGRIASILSSWGGYGVNVPWFHTQRDESMFNGVLDTLKGMR
jgi:hypothetical protein